MYKIVNGILEKNNKKVFALGESYYPSFHKYKYPVPPEGDRIGEMKKDFKAMKDMGFNHIRIAAIGTVKLSENGELTIDTPFVDAMIDEAEKQDISISVRLQGYSVNLRDFKDVCMINADGNPQDLSAWFDFIQTTLCHEGILEDNRFLSEKLSSYYAKKESVVGFQIYNEPHFPGSVFFDYHPCAIEAYRKWLVKHNIMTKSESKSYFPPRKRKEQSPRMWALWRLFSQESLSNFLDNASIPAKAATGLPTFTCLTTCSTIPASPYRGADLFANARTSMDIIGYTCYFHAVGEEYYPMNLLLDITACAAKAEKKETWCIELDSRTSIPKSLFNKNSYATIGSGAKGIVYYQWRGDYPSKATPIPNGCGLVNYDGSKTDNFDNAAKTVVYINEMSDYIVNSERANDGIGIFHSDYAIFMCDAIENTDEERRDITLSNSYLMQYKDMYSDLRKKNYTVNVVDACTLKNNAFDLYALFVPRRDFLSPEEQSIIEDFIANGGIVFESPTLIADVVCTNRGYTAYGTGIADYNLFCNINEICEEFLKKPAVSCDNPLVGIQRLVGKDYSLIVLTNLSCSERKQSLKLTFTSDICEATLCTPYKKQKLSVLNNEVFIDGLSDGGIVVVK